MEANDSIKIPHYIFGDSYTYKLSNYSNNDASFDFNSSIILHYCCLSLWKIRCKLNEFIEWVCCFRQPLYHA